MKNANNTVSVPRLEFDQIGQLLETIQSQSRVITQLVAEKQERLRRDAAAEQRRKEVFRIPVRP